MFLHLDEWPWFLNIYKARLLQICYVMYFCNVYTWILIKYQLHFDFLVVFTLLVRPCQLLYHVSWLLYYWSLHSAFLFFVLASGRPLRVTMLFVFSRPLCCHFAAQIVIPEFSVPPPKRCLSLSKGFPLQHETAKICYCCSQPFYSSFVALLEVILQRCNSAARFVWECRHSSRLYCYKYCTTCWVSSSSKNIPRRPMETKVSNSKRTNWISCGAAFSIVDIGRLLGTLGTRGFFLLAMRSFVGHRLTCLWPKAEDTSSEAASGSLLRLDRNQKKH